MPPADRKAGRPKRLRPLSPELLALNEVNREKQADNLRRDAYQFGRIIGNSIRLKLRDNEEKGLRELVWSWGVSVDKVLGGVESSGLTLAIPAALLDKFMLAVQLKPANDTKTSIGTTTTSVTDQQVTSEKIG